MEEQEQLTDAVAVVWKQRKLIIRWTLVTVIITALLSLLLKNYYKASTTFYPASLDLSKPDQIFGNTTKEMEFYGSSQDLDRLLTICSSNELKDMLVQEFGLFAHYKIDSSKILAKHKIRKKLDKLMSVTKTKYDAIELSIEDQDKSLATQMVNRARDIVNTLSHDLIISRLTEVSKLYQSSILEKSALSVKLSDSLSALRKIYPIYNVDAQTETLANLATELNNQYIGEKARYDALKAGNAPKDTLMYLSAKIKGLEMQIKALNTGDGAVFNLKNFNEGVNKIYSLENTIQRLEGQINEDKIKYQNTINTIESKANALITVITAEIPDYKSRPKRSLLVIGVGMCAALALALFYLIKHYSIRST